MRELFLTTTRPKHRYKSAKYFTAYFSLRRRSFFGALAGRRDSFTKKILVLKKFFSWYYQIVSFKLFKKVFHKTFLKRRVSFRSLLAFFHLLEKNILTLLVRSGFCLNMKEASFLVRSGFVFVNGGRVCIPCYFGRISDTLEILTWQKFSFLYHRSVLFFSRDLLYFRLNYLFGVLNYFFIKFPINLNPPQYKFNIYKYTQLYAYVKELK
jgi:hypothetical protein